MSPNAKKLTDKLFSFTELAGWSEEKHIAFLRFCESFIEQTPKGTGYRITPEKRQAAEELAASDPNVKEFLQRIQLPTGETTDKQFYFRLMTMVRLVLKYLKLNPECISPAMRAVIEPSKHFNSCLAVRAEVAPVFAPIQPYSLEEKQAYAAERVVGIIHLLIDSVEQRDIEQMSPKDRILAASRLKDFLDIRKHPPRRQSALSKLNIDTASIAEMEAAVLEISREE